MGLPIAAGIAQYNVREIPDNFSCHSLCEAAGFLAALMLVRFAEMSSAGFFRRSVMRFIFQAEHAQVCHLHLSRAGVSSEQ